MSSVVPQGWAVHDLGELAKKIEGGGTPPRTEPSYWDGDIPWASVKDLRAVELDTTEEFISELGLANSSSRLVPSETMIIASRMAVGKAVFFTRAVAINQDLKAFYPKESVYWKFLLYWYLSRNEQIAHLATGSTVKGIRLEELKLLPICLPPLPEQQKIAAILSSVDDVIEKTRAQIDKLKDLKTGMMQELLTKGIGHIEFKDSQVGRIPRAWTCEFIGTLFEIQLGKMLSSAAKTGKSPFPYLGNKNVQWGKVDLTDLETMDFSERERKKFLLKPGDLLMCEGGDVGRSAIWKGELKECYYQKAIHRLRPRADAYEPRLLLEYMRYAKTRNLLSEFISQTSIAHLTREKLSVIPVPVPPKEEQEKIIGIVDSLDARIDAHLGKLNGVTNMKKALMQDLLTGKVRVKVNNNESAAASSSAAAAEKLQDYA